MANRANRGSARKGRNQFGMRKKKPIPGSVVQEGPGDTKGNTTGK
jgi:hypothetical protein